MVLLSAAIKGVPDDTLEAARLDGATESQVFWQDHRAADPIDDRRRVHDGHDRRAQGLRHRLRHDRRQLQHQRDRRPLRPGAVRLPPLRHRLGDRRVPDDRDDPDHHVQHPHLQGAGGDPRYDRDRPASRSTWSEAKTPFASRAGEDPQPAQVHPLHRPADHDALPAVDHPDVRAVRSRRSAPRSDVNTSGWWTVFTSPFDFGQWTLENYRQVLDAGGIGHGVPQLVRRDDPGRR